MNTPTPSSTVSDNKTSNDTTTFQLEPRSEGVNAIISGLIFIIILAAVVGNILVIAAVNMYHRLKNEVSSTFIVNLCVTDLSSASIVMFSSAIAVTLDRWPLGSVFCSIVCGANYCFIIVSMLTLCFISLDRYIAIQWSLHYHIYVTKPRVIILIVYSWMQGFAFGLAPIICGWVKYDYWEATCAIQWHLYGIPVRTYVIVAFLLCFLLPGIILTVAYCKIFKTAKKIKPRARPAIQMVSPGNGQSNNPSTSGDDVNSFSQSAVQSTSCKTKYSDSSKAVRSMLIVVMAYFICMTPFSVTKLYKVCVPVPNALPGYANMMATFFQYMGSAVNPLIYGLFRHDFQQAFLYLMWKMIRRHNIHITPSQVLTTTSDTIT